MLILLPAEESLNMIFATMASRIETELKAAVVSGRVRANVDEIVSEGHRAASQLLVGKEEEKAEAEEIKAEARALALAPWPERSQEVSCRARQGRS